MIDHDPEPDRAGAPLRLQGLLRRRDAHGLLEAAGAARARLLVVAIDDADGGDADRAQRARSRFPQLEVVVRAHSRTDAFEYAELGMPRGARDLRLGARRRRARAARARLFGPRGCARIVAALPALRRGADRAADAPHRNELKQLIALQQQGRRDIERLLAAEVHQRDAGGDEQRGEREVRAERL